MEEYWREYNPKYEVSNLGNVRHIRHKKILKHNISTGGYPQVDVGKTMGVHCLVATCFLGAIPNGFHIHHKDKNQFNNNVDNLEYKEAFIHRSEHHRKFPSHGCQCCGKTIYHSAKTCSQKCYDKIHYEERFCKICGKKFTVSKKIVKWRLSNIERYNNIGIYCSAQCFHIGMIK